MSIVPGLDPATGWYGAKAPELSELASGAIAGSPWRSPDGVIYLPGDARSPRGFIVRHIGRRYPARALTRAPMLINRPTAGTVAAFVRAWPVRVLDGVTIAVRDQAELPTAIRAILVRRLGAFDWAREPQLQLDSEGYGLLRVQVAAPWDEGTGQPTNLELAVAGPPHLMPVPPRPAAHRRAPVPRGPLQLRVSSAIWANVRSLGLDMPAFA